MHPESTEVDCIAATQRWLERAVIGLNLCPFAKAVHVKEQIRWVASAATDEQSLRRDFVHELEFLRDADPALVDTTLLIHPFVLNDFIDYNDFLDVADAALAQLGLDGAIQIASFHPDYRFADSNGDDDIANFSNRAPYPTLHLLRESSIEAALAAFPDAAAIYERNIDTLQRLGLAGWRRLWL
jgi:hypothetical protein